MQEGYIALISIIIIALILSTITVTLSFSGFLWRFNIIDEEFKEKSVGLAESCVQIALLKLSQNPAYCGMETHSVGSGECTVLEVEPCDGAYGEKIIKAWAEVNKSYTNLIVSVNINDNGEISILSWVEAPKF